MNAVLEIINYEEVNELCCLRGTMTTNQIHRVAISLQTQVVINRKEVITDTTLKST